MSAPAVQNSVASARRIDAALIGLILGAVILWFAPVGMGRYGTYVLSLWLVMSIGVMGLNLTLGYAGIFNYAQIALFAFGAYATGMLTLKLGLPPFAGLVLATMLTGLLGLLIALPMTCLVLAYYRRLVLKQEEGGAETDGPPSASANASY